MASEEQPQAEATVEETPVVEAKPDRSRAVVLTGTGGLNKVDVRKVAKPQPGEGCVLIKVHACGLNFADIMQRQGLYPGGMPPIPYIMGFECSGVVEAVGQGVTEFEVGARVVAISLSFGMMAEYVAPPVAGVFHIPDSMSFEDAACLPVNYVTAYQILFDIGHLKEGESVLVHMAGGGVGVAATQLCKTVPNVTVFGTASQPKHEKIKGYGVTHPIDYRNNCFAKEVRKVQADGVDIVMDPLGGKDTMKGYDLLKPLGRIICYGAANIVKGQSKGLFTSAKMWYQTTSFSPFKLMPDNKIVAGYHVGKLAIASPEKVRAAMEALIKLHEEGKIKPEIHHVFALEEIRGAMQCMQDRKNVGKVLLSPLKEPPAPEPKEQPKQEKVEEPKEAEKQEEKEEDKVDDKPSEEENKEKEGTEEAKEEAKEEGKDEGEEGKDEGKEGEGEPKAAAQTGEEA